MEHGPQKSDTLLAFLNEVAGPHEDAIHVPVSGAGGRYMGRYRFKHCEACDPICDMCSPRWAKEPAVRLSLRAVPVTKLRRYTPDFRCFVSNAICVHMRRRDWADHGDVSHRLMDDAVFVAAVHSLRAKLPPNTPLFVSTNGNTTQVTELFRTHKQRTIVHGPDAFLLTELAQFVHCCSALVLSASSFSDVVRILSSARLLVHPGLNRTERREETPAI